MGKTTLRHATYDDLDLLMEIAEAMHAESPRFSRLSFSPKKVLAFYITLIDQPDSLLLVAERDGVIAGGVAAFVCPHWFSDDVVANEYGVFILPEYRGGMTAARLVRGYIEWAKEKGAKMTPLVYIRNLRPTALQAVSRNLGFYALTVFVCKKYPLLCFPGREFLFVCVVAFQKTLALKCCLIQYEKRRIMAI